jgi:AAA family ATP:ADP antiporter
MDMGHRALNLFPEVPSLPPFYRWVRHFLASTFVLERRMIGKVLFHGLILSFIIAGFWLLDSLKDPVLTTIVGIEYQPMAKLGSVFVTLLTTFMYEYATTKLKKLELFHLVSSVFGLVFLILSALLSDPLYGLKIEERGPQNIIGWLSYFMIEAYGSLMVALFWSYTNSIMNLEEAKGAYGLIISVAQIGAILGSTMATQATQVGIPILFLAGSMTIFCISLLMKVYVIIFPKKKRYSSRGAEHGPRKRLDSGSEYFGVRPNSHAEGPAVVRQAGGISEGLILVFRNSYTRYILGISCIYEVVVTILDYQFKVLGAASVAQPEGGEMSSQRSEDEFALLLGHFGQVTNVFSFLVSLLGFSFLVNRIGVRASLMIFPTLLFIGVIVTNLLSSLWVLFVTVSLIKAVIFSFHDPVKELLYIPTSEAIKFKAKAWIDVFGARSAKALGSFICYASFGNANTLRTIGEIPCILASLTVLVVAYLAGSEFQRLVDNGIVISAEGESEIDTNSSPSNSNENIDDLAGDIPLRSASKSFDDGEGSLRHLRN